MPAKFDVSISKLDGNGKLVANVKNPKNIAWLSIFLMANPASQAIRKLSDNAQFLHDCTTGQGVYHLHKTGTGDDGKPYDVLFKCDKKNVARAIELVKEIGKLVTEFRTLVTEQVISGVPPTKGKGETEYDPSEL